ncbi:hypothetical protein [Cerasicoccus arenae]|uniref:Uncharacterized protein n=1 Tax=Cerasicoccus arenae TaxID=424488 RepID=A0A8J3DDW2_9BACT|nr:hypothetical protein [Cerasicoccus arenae]MBK1859495.1 hypothetical protein [Cerasicoccus arenae]GHB94973.1 hypothetical protein GCM10007047_08170 [Cerasicoccus arenae]
MKLAGIGCAIFFVITAWTLQAQTLLTPAGRTITIEGSRITQANFPNRGEFLLFRPDVDYAGLRNAPVSKADDPLSKKIQTWFDEGTAAGNVGDLYENRDGGHSRLNLKKFGQFAQLVYGEELKKLGADFGVKIKIVNERPTLVNASLAMLGKPFARSMARLIMHNPELSPELYSMYRIANICFYPEHADHDKRNGDLFAVNTPYLIISQGSSGSDIPFMEATAQTLASFQPSVKELLHQHGLLAPTVQMIMRWSNDGIGNADNYLTGKAHPTVFDATKLRPDAMAEMAHAMKPDHLPPLALIRMTQETQAVSGVDYFDSDVGEILMETPCAIGRVARNLSHSRTFRVSAADSFDVRHLPLNYHWKVLRGDESKINIHLLNGAGNEAEITVDYQPETLSHGDPQLRSHRVDIGVFVDNGVYYSAPAFISIWYPPNEKREYDDDGHLEKVTYLSAKKVGVSADVVLLFDKPWSDIYSYDDDKISGWVRQFDNGDTASFNAKGKQIETGWFSSDKPTAVKYVITPTNEGYRKIDFE